MARLTLNNGSDGSAAPGQQDAESKRKSRRSRRGQRAQSDAASGAGRGSGPSESLVPGQEDAARGAMGQGPVAGGEADEPPKLFSEKDSQLSTGPDYGYSRIRFHKKDEVNIYAEQQDERLGMDPRARHLVILGIVTVVSFIVACVLPTQIYYNVAVLRTTPAELIVQFQAMCGGFIGFLTGGTSQYTAYAWEIVAALLAGAALGLTGGVYQGALKNALASPSTLGVTQGGTLGIIIYAIFMYNGSYTGKMSGYKEWLATLSPWEVFCESYGQFFAALLGCVIVVAVILGIATIAGHGKVSNVSLVVAGQVFAAVVAVVISWIKYYLMTFSSDPDLVELLNESQSASFTGTYQASTVLVFAIPLIICMVIVFAMSSRIMLLSFSDDEARSMGISTTAMRNIMVVLCTVLTALVVSFVGMIGFVGFLIPHIARRFIGPDFRYLLPASALLGAAFVVIVHCISEMGIPGIVTGSTGLITSTLGCIAFLVTALRQRGNASGEWL